MPSWCDVLCCDALSTGAAYRSRKYRFTQHWRSADSHSDDHVCFREVNSLPSDDSKWPENHPDTFILKRTSRSNKLSTNWIYGWQIKWLRMHMICSWINTLHKHTPVPSLRCCVQTLACKCVHAKVKLGGEAASSLHILRLVISSLSSPAEACCQTDARIH